MSAQAPRVADVEIRRIVPSDDLDADARDAADVCLRSRKASFPDIPAPVHTDEEVREYWADLVFATMHVWVAEVPGPRRPTIVGVVAVHDDWVEQLYVDPSVFGCGIGSRLLAAAKDARPEGLQLWTFAANRGARRFYERHGFVAVESTDGDNEEGEPDVRYEWRPDVDR